MLLCPPAREPSHERSKTTSTSTSDPAAATADARTGRTRLGVQVEIEPRWGDGHVITRSFTPSSIGDIRGRDAGRSGPRLRLSVVRRDVVRGRGRARARVQRLTGKERRPPLYIFLGGGVIVPLFRIVIIDFLHLILRDITLIPPPRLSQGFSFPACPPVDRTSANRKPAHRLNLPRKSITTETHRMSTTSSSPTSSS